MSSTLAAALKRIADSVRSSELDDLKPGETKKGVLKDDKGKPVGRFVAKNMGSALDDLHGFKPPAGKSPLDEMGDTPLDGDDEEMGEPHDLEDLEMKLDLLREKYPDIYSEIFGEGEESTHDL